LSPDRCRLRFAASWEMCNQMKTFGFAGVEIRSFPVCIVNFRFDFHCAHLQSSFLVTKDFHDFLVQRFEERNDLAEVAHLRKRPSKKLESAYLAFSSNCMRYSKRLPNDVHSGVTKGGGGAMGDICPRAEHFGGAKLRSECHIIITKCQRMLIITV